MGKELGSDYSGGDYLNSESYNDVVPAHNKSKTDSPDSNKSRVKAAHVNDLSAEIVGLAARLGAGFRGSQTDLKARLDRGQNDAGDPGGKRQTIGFDDLLSAINNEGVDPVSGMIEGEPSKTETIDLIDSSSILYLESNTELKLPVDFKIDRTKSELTAVPGGDFSGQVIYAVGKHDIIIDGGWIEGNAANDGIYNEWDHAIYLANCDRVRIRNMRLTNQAGDGITISGCRDVLIENCYIENPNINPSAPLIGRNGIAVEAYLGYDIASERIIINNCIIDGGNPACIDIEPSDYIIDSVIISNCILRNGFRGIAVETGAESTAKNVEISNCIIDGCGWGISLNGANVIENVKIRGCQIINSTDYGIIALTVDEVAIISSKIRGNGDDGILFSGQNKNMSIIGCLIEENAGYGVNVASVNGSESENLQVVSSIIKNNSFGNANVKSGLRIAETLKILIASCFFIDDQDTPTQKYPAEILSCEDGIFTTNLSDGHATSDLDYEQSCTNFERSNNLINGAINQSEILNLSGSTAYEIKAEVGSGDDMLRLTNDRSGAGACTAVINKGTFVVWQQDVGLAIVKLNTVQIADGNFGNAAVPANFAANKTIKVYDATGNTYYIPAMTATW